MGTESGDHLGVCVCVCDFVFSSFTDFDYKE